jgi:hypothetical protein
MKPRISTRSTTKIKKKKKKIWVLLYWAGGQYGFSMSFV